MKLGAENKTTTIVAMALMIVAIFLLARMWTGGGQPAAAANATAPQPAAQTPAPVRGRRGSRSGRTPARNTPANNSLDPRLRLDLLKLSEDTEYSGKGRNIFIAQAEIPKPIENPVKEAQKTPEPPPGPPPPPPPPPINIKFVGFASGGGEPTQVILSQGDNIFVAREGQIVNRRYKVNKINANSVEIEDLLSNNRQTIPLTAG
jgi:hypothetical protein